MISPLRGHNNFDTIRNHLHRSQSSSPLSYHEREVGATASSIEISGRMITRDSAFTGFEREIIDLVRIIRIIGLRGEGDCTGVDWCAARFRIDYAGFWDGLERPGHAVCRLNCSFDAVHASLVSSRNVQTRTYAQHTRCSSDPGIKRIQTWKISWKFVNSTETDKGMGWLPRSRATEFAWRDRVNSLSFFFFLSLSLFLFGHTIDCAHRWQWNVIGIRTGSGGAWLIDFVRDKISFLQFLASVLLWRSLYWADVLTEIRGGSFQDGLQGMIVKWFACWKYRIEWTKNRGEVLEKIKFYYQSLLTVIVWRCLIVLKLLV